LRTPPLAAIQKKYELLRPLLNERQRRLWAASEARTLGRGGIAQVARATHMSPHTVRAGLRELEGLEQGVTVPVEPDRVRQPGAGRKPRVAQSPGLLADLDALIEPIPSGNTRSPLRWTCEGTGRLASLLQAQGHSVSPRLVARLLRQLGYRLIASRKSSGSAKHPDRSAQYDYANGQVETFHRRGQPVVALTTARRGVSANGTAGGPTDEAGPADEGRDGPGEAPPDEAVSPSAAPPVCPEGEGDELAAPPAGDLVPVHVEQDTVGFVVAMLRYWWWQLGRPTHPDAKDLLVVTDLAGVRGKTSRFWKLALQRLADETGLAVTVCYFPPGTTRWARVDQCLTGQVDLEADRGRVQQQVCARLVGSVSSAAGTVLRPEFDRRHQQSNLRALESVVPSLLLEPAPFHGDWNYTVRAHPVPVPTASGQLSG
jgi:Rhodopirellula transposase DDE domain